MQTDQKTERTHTPGPWHVEAYKHAREGGDDQVYIATDDGSVMAEIYGDDGDSMCWPVTANARLMAAAPDLLKSLEFVQKYMAMRETKGDPLPSQLTESVANAIRKATQEQS